MTVWVEDSAKIALKRKRKFSDEDAGYSFAKQLANAAKARGEQSEDRFYVWYGDPIPSAISPD